MVTDAYNRRCAITGESTLPVLEAAHIRPFAKSGSNEVTNGGRALRADFHKLFDVGLVTVTPDLRVEVSPQIRKAWFNGESTIDSMEPLSNVPQNPTDRPDATFLNWHNENCFLG